jgi:hypothetical protein
LADRKNIFLIGRRGHEGDEDQLTEMLAFLWQERPETLYSWLDSLGLPVAGERAEIETQFVLPSGKRPDIAISSGEGRTLVESKLGSGFGDTQIQDYLDYLRTVEGRRALVLLTQRPETVPPELRARADDQGVTLLARRWQDMAESMGESGEGSLEGDFVQLLIREGLVKPQPFEGTDWTSWNAGYNVLLRVDTFLDELDPHVKRIDPNLRKTGSPGLTKRWLYKVWRTPSFEVGLGFGAAGGESPRDPPIIFAFVGNSAATLDDALSAVGATREKRDAWTHNPELNEWCGLLWDWPSLARNAGDVLTGELFDDQLRDAAGFMFRTVRYFQSRGYVPATLNVPQQS